MNDVAHPRRCAADLEDELATFLEATTLFRVLRQVMGRPLWIACPTAGWVRCDLLLLPSRSGLAAGWRHGPILLKVQRPGEPIASALSQMMDWLRSSWLLPNGVPIMASWAFVYPAERVHGPLGTVARHNHVRTATLNAGELGMYSGEQRVLTVYEGGVLSVGQVVHVGRRSRSRSPGGRTWSKTA